MTISAEAHARFHSVMRFENVHDDFTRALGLTRIAGQWWLAVKGTSGPLSGTLRRSLYRALRSS
jgi:hypothetical protein